VNQTRSFAKNQRVDRPGTDATFSDMGIFVCLRFSATRFVVLLPLGGMGASPFDFPFGLAQGFVLRPQAKTWQALHPTARRPTRTPGPFDFAQGRLWGSEEETFIFRTAVG
jgi:hypothetical protein